MAKLRTAARKSQLIFEIPQTINTYRTSATFINLPKTPPQVYVQTYRCVLDIFMKGSNSCCSSI